MLLPCITFRSDSFWAAANLGVLRMLMSTCKGFRAELLGDAKKQQTLFDHALMAIVQRRRPIGVEWAMTLETAKYRFSLQEEDMIKYCGALPVEDDFHLSDDDARRFREGWFPVKIRFIDAYKLASEHGLKAAMERRCRFETKVMHSAYETLALLGGGRLTKLRLNVRSAGDELKKNLAALHKDVVGKKRSELRKRIRLLKKLHADLCSAESTEEDVRDEMRSTRKDFLSMEEDVNTLKRWKKTLVARCKGH